MTGKTREEKYLTQFLLGELSEGERERLEESHFADDDAFEQMLLAEDALIDAYARGELSVEQRRRFEERFLASSRGRERVQFAHSLAGAVSDARSPVTTLKPTPRPSRPPFFTALSARGVVLRFAFAAATLAVVLGLTWLLFERVRMREELQQLRADRAAIIEKAQEMERRAAAEQTRSAEMLAQLEASRVRPKPEVRQQGTEAGSQRRSPQANRLPRGQVKKNDAVLARRAPGQAHKPPLQNTTDATIGSTSESQRIDRLPLQERTVAALLGSVSFDLTPGLVRGGGAHPLLVPDKTTFILFQLNLEADSSHDNYSAVIETADGRPVWRADSVKPRRPTRQGGVIELPAVPVRDLPPGDYILSLSGRRPDGGLIGVADYSFRIVRK